MAAVGVGLWEASRLTGKWDWRSFPGEAAPDRWKASLARLDGPDGEGAMVHVAHSTHLLSVAGVRMLTDPWFYDPAFGAMSHEVLPAVAPAEIGPLDVILVTHRHADHFDPVAVDQLDKRALVVVNEADLAARARALGFTNVEVLAPWATIDVRGARISAVPGVHDIPEIGFVVQGAGRSVYFAGDTRLHDDLPAIKERFAPSAAILPVDGTRLTGGDKWVMTPEDAVAAARILGVRLAMPSHAEAYFSDLFAKGALVSTVAAAPAKFVDAMAATLPGVAAVAPLPGELVPLTG